MSHSKADEEREEWLCWHDQIDILKKDIEALESAPNVTEGKKIIRRMTQRLLYVVEEL
jgi:hypothetical protein